MNFLRNALTTYWNFWRYKIPNGLENLWHWFPLIWRDRDWDWAFLAAIMEHKLIRMADNCENYGHHLSDPQHIRQMRVAAALLRRLQDDNYLRDCEKGYFNKKAKPYYKATYERGLWRHRSDQRYLGFIIGKYLTHWWD